MQAGEFRTVVQAAAKALLRHQQETRQGAVVVRQAPLPQIVAELGLARYVREGGLQGTVLVEFLERYLSYCVRLNHPGELAHQVAAPHPAAAVATLVEGFTNNPMAIFEMGPAAASIEAFLLDWMLAKVGWANGGAGVLTHGGSLANLTALAAARSRLDGDLWMEGGGRLAVIGVGECHYSVARAAGLMGIGERHLRLAAGPSEIAGLARRLREEGRQVVACVASACHTATGAFDDLRAVGDACREAGVWLHVDGAHGASVLLSERHRHKMAGVELADSLTWDAHKLMRTPGLCTAVLVRERAALDGALQQEASYLFHEKEQIGFDFIHRTVECTKSSMGFRLFVVLGAMGEVGMAGYIDRQIAVAQSGWRLMRAKGLECAVEPQCNILCFRVAGSDEKQLAIRDQLLAEGEFHLSTAVVSGRRWLRLVVTSPETGEQTLERLAARLLELDAAS